jgi:hypothetical protein
MPCTACRVAAAAAAALPGTGTQPLPQDPVRRQHAGPDSSAIPLCPCHSCVPQQLEGVATQILERPQLEAIAAAAGAPLQQVGDPGRAALAWLEVRATLGATPGPGIQLCWLAMQGSSACRRWAAAPPVIAAQLLTSVLPLPLLLLPRRQVEACIADYQLFRRCMGLLLELRLQEQQAGSSEDSRRHWHMLADTSVLGEQQAAGLLGCWAAGLLGCWAAGLLGCWAAGLLGWCARPAGAPAGWCCRPAGWQAGGCRHKPGKGQAGRASSHRRQNACRGCVRWRAAACL